MKKIILALTLGLFGFGAATAQAIDIGVNASYWDTEDADATWGVGGKIGMPFFIERIHLEVRAYQFKEEEVALFGDVDIIPLDLGLAFYITQEESVNPYIVGGISYNFVDASEIGLDDDYGYYIGGGLEVPLGEGFALTGEAIFRAAEFDSKAGLDESFDTTGTTMNVGLRFRF